MTFSPSLAARSLEDVIVCALRDEDLISPLQLDAISKAEVIADKVEKDLKEAYEAGYADCRRMAILAVGGEP